VVCDEDLVEDDDHDECEDDSLDEILNHEHEKIREKCQTLNDLTLVIEKCQLLPISSDEKCDDSLDEIFHEEISLDEMIETENDDHEVMEIIH
jgi:hypothetical protein